LVNFSPRDNWPLDDVLVRYLHDLGPKSDVVMVADPDRSSKSRLVQFGTFLGRKNAVTDWQGGKLPPSSGPNARPVVFVIHPGRLQELQAIKGLYPGGTEEEQKASGKTFWVIYRYEPAS